VTDVGVEFGFLLMRLTGKSSLELRRGKIRLAPVIEAGKESGDEIARYRAPDKFKHFEMYLTVPWYRAPFVARVLRKETSLQMWTNTDALDGEYVEWLFPYTHWRRRGWSNFYELLKN
jgi:hypothetical protein